MIYLFAYYVLLKKHMMPGPRKSYLTCSRRAYYIFFPVPCAGLFSVKIQEKILAIKNFSVNETMSGQPNKHLIH